MNLLLFYLKLWGEFLPTLIFKSQKLFCEYSHHSQQIGVEKGINSLFKNNILDRYALRGFAFSAL
jgi:hypothetical protein